MCKINIRGAPISFPIWSRPCKVVSRKDVLTSVVEARAKATSCEDRRFTHRSRQGQAVAGCPAQLSGALGPLLAVSEIIRLEINQNFLPSIQLGTKTASVARRDYIDAVRAYNPEPQDLSELAWAATFSWQQAMANSPQRSSADASASQILTFSTPRRARMTLLAGVWRRTALSRRVKCPSPGCLAAALFAAFAFVNLAVAYVFPPLPGVSWIPPIFRPPLPPILSPKHFLARANPAFSSLWRR
jgi:hypothetical protein